MLKKLIKQRSHTFCYLLILILSAGFYSCEFDSKDFNYVHLEKPIEEIQLGLDLAGVNPHEIIYVYNNSLFSYSLFTDGKDILSRQFYLDGNPIATNQQTGEAFLNYKALNKLYIIITLLFINNTYLNH